MMAEVAATKENVERFRVINVEKVTWVEDQTDKLSKLVELPAEFIISGNSPAGAALNLARTIVRRAERHIADIIHQGEMDNIEILRYINRLSTLCFLLEGVENNAAGKDLFTLAKE